MAWRNYQLLLVSILGVRLSQAFTQIPGSTSIRHERLRFSKGAQNPPFRSEPSLFLLGRDPKDSTTREVAPPFVSGDENGTSDGRLSLVLLQAQDVLSPAAQALDDATDGWALSYADLSPETESTPIGQAFLASNIAYALAGLLLSIQGETLMGLLTEFVSVASFIYHYTQLQASSKEQDSTVRLALMIDYTLAFTTIFLGLFYIAIDHRLPPIEGFVSGGVGIVCLLACWVWEQGLPYIILHSLWHFFSAYCGYVVGNTHISG